MDILTNDEEHAMLERQEIMPFKHYFRVDEDTDPYKLVENINKVLNRFGFKVVRVVKSGKGCYDTPYYFKIMPAHSLEVN
jgi:hypothetical protein